MEVQWRQEKKTSESWTPQKVASVVFDSIAIPILVTEMPTGKMTFVEPTCLGPNLWALGVHLQSQQSRLSSGAVSTHRASRSKFLASFVSYHQDLVTLRSSLRGSWATNKIIKKKKENETFLFIKFSVCQARSYNPRLWVQWWTPGSPSCED